MRENGKPGNWSLRLSHHKTKLCHYKSPSIFNGHNEETTKMLNQVQIDANTSFIQT